MIDQSGIEILPNVVEVPQTDWVFFSSSGGVHQFFEQTEVVEAVKYAAIGEETAKVLRRFVTPDFIGQGNPNEVGKAFLHHLEKETVLFPIGQRSKRSVQKTLPPEQVIEVQVYTTNIVQQQLPEADYYLFTSPSNVAAFLSQGLVPNGKYIAIGETTNKALLEHDVKATIAPFTSIQSMFTLIK